MAFDINHSVRESNQFSSHSTVHTLSTFVLKTASTCVYLCDHDPRANCQRCWTWIESHLWHLTFDMNQYSNMRSTDTFTYKKIKTYHLSKLSCQLFIWSRLLPIRFPSDLKADLNWQLYLGQTIPIQTKCLKLICARDTRRRARIIRNRWPRSEAVTPIWSGDSDH